MSDEKREIIHTLVSELCFENGKNSKRVARDFAGTVDKLEKRAASASKSFNLLNKSIKDTLVGQHFEKAISKYKELWDAAKDRNRNIGAATQQAANQKKYLPDRLYQALARINKTQTVVGHNIVHKLDRVDLILRKQIAQTNKAYFGKLDTQFLRNFVERIQAFEKEHGRLPDFVTGEKTSVNQKAGIWEWETPDHKFFREVNIRDTNEYTKPLWRRIMDEFSPTQNMKKWRNEITRNDHIFGFQFLFANSVIDRLNEINKSVIKLEHPLANLGFDLGESFVHHMARIFPGWAVILSTMLTGVLERHRQKQMQKEIYEKVNNVAAIYHMGFPEAESYVSLNEKILNKEYDSEEILNALKKFSDSLNDAEIRRMDFLELLNLFIGTGIRKGERFGDTRVAIDFFKEYGVSSETASILATKPRDLGTLIAYGANNDTLGIRDYKIRKTIEGYDWEKTLELVEGLKKQSKMFGFTRDEKPITVPFYASDAPLPGYWSKQGKFDQPGQFVQQVMEIPQTAEFLSVIHRMMSNVRKGDNLNAGFENEVTPSEYEIEGTIPNAHTLISDEQKQTRDIAYGIVQDAIHGKGVIDESNFLKQYMPLAASNYALLSDDTVKALVAELQQLRMQFGLYPGAPGPKGQFGSIT